MNFFTLHMGNNLMLSCHLKQSETLKKHDFMIILNFLLKCVMFCFYILSYDKNNRAVIIKFSFMKPIPGSVPNLAKGFLYNPFFSLV